MNNFETLIHCEITPINTVQNSIQIYPRIARLTSQAIDLLAQCRPGVRVRFEVLYSK
jgi:allophanate hydrolase subunit 2